MTCHLGGTLLALLLCFAGGPAVVRADIQLPAKGRTKGERQVQKSTPPPSPVATRVRLQAGGRAEIVLQATGSLGKTVEFLLRTPPAHGGFEGEPRRVGLDRIALTYVHRLADGPGHDTFAFAAQAAGTPVSAAETVEIEIVDPAPDPAPVASGAPDVVARPSELDFGAVESGRSTTATFALENRGGGLASGRLELPTPWTVDGDASYRLERGGRQMFRILFNPTAEGSFAETLQVPVDGADRTAGCVVRLIGTGLIARPAPSPKSAAAATPAPAVSVPPATPSLVPVADAGPSVRATPGTLPDPATTAPSAVNDAQVTNVTVRAVGATTIELAWKPPVPLPASYRVERRSFASDEREPGGVRTDWTLLGRTDFHVRADQVTATVRGLVPGEPFTVRVASVDAAGNLSAPSPNVDVTTMPASTWWHPTPLKMQVVALAICVGLIVRRRWQERRLVRELDARHMSGDEDSLSYAPK